MNKIKNLDSYEPLFGSWHVNKILKEYNDIAFADIVNSKEEHATLKIIILSKAAQFGCYNLHSFLDRYKMKDLDDLGDSPYILEEDHYLKENDQLIIFFICREKWTDEEDPESAEDLYNLGNKYLYGKGRIHDEYKGVRLILEAANKDYPPAQNRIGECYENGYGTEEDLDKAFSWYEKSANTNDKDGLYNYGRCYLYGIGTEEDPYSSIYYLQQSALYGVPEAAYVLGTCYLQGKGVDQDLERAFDYIKNASEKLDDDGEVFFTLGLMYERGDGTEPDMNKAFRCYEKSAALDFPGGLISLAECYNYGKGVEQNLDKTFKCVKRVADRGDERMMESIMDSNNYYGQAKYLLGRFYFDGVGTEQDYEEALDCFETSDFYGWPYAAEYIGKHYHYGLGVDQDYDKAISYYNAAVENGIGNAIYDLGVLYATAPEKYNDIDKAYKCFNFVYGQGYMDSGLALGLCCIFNKGTKNYERRGLRILEETAQAKDAENNKVAAYCAGYCYQNGLGTNVDLEKARQWYNLSLNLGYVKAQEQIDMIDRQ